MTIQLRRDLRTIVEVLVFIAIWFAVGSSWLSTPIWLLLTGLYLYNYFTVRKRKDTVIFPTQNDGSSKMAFISIGMVIISFSIISYFVFHNPISLTLTGIMASIGIILLGIFEPAKGYIKITKNLLKIKGIDREHDIRMLKEITLKNDKIILTNIYGEHNSCVNLKLNPSSAEKIKTFLIGNLTNNEILINDLVVNEL